MAHKKGWRRELDKYKNISVQLRQMEDCDGINKRVRGYPGQPGRRVQHYQVTWGRNIKCDLLTLQRIRRELRYEDLRMHTWIKSITPMTGSAGGWIVEYDVFDTMVRFETIAYYDHSFNKRWAHSVDVDSPLKIGWPGKPIIEFKPTLNAHKNRTYRRAD